LNEHEFPLIIIVRYETCSYLILRVVSSLNYVLHFDG